MATSFLGLVQAISGCNDAGRENECEADAGNGRDVVGIGGCFDLTV